MRPSDRTRLLDRAANDFAVIQQHLEATITRVTEWASGLGFPAGSGGGAVAGGDATPLPERLVVAADGRALDAHAADLAELDVTLALVCDGLAWLTAFVARNTPTRRNPDDRPTATCGDPLSVNALKRGCGRVIAATKDDPVRAGLCDQCYWKWRDSFRTAVIGGTTYHA